MWNRQIIELIFIFPLARGTAAEMDFHFLSLLKFDARGGFAEH